MIITQTPLRVSLAGGGTDFPDYFRREGGAVLSMAIDKYVYVIIQQRFDEKIYINYSQKEIVDRVEEIKHELVREAMWITGVEQGVEITTLADVPSEGAGLGSSSSVTVGLLNAFYAYQGMQVPAEQLAREACRIEVEILGKPIGFQDQYIAAYGNLRFIEFRNDGTVAVEKVAVPEARKRRLASNLLLFFTNRTRSATTILSGQRQGIGDRLGELGRLRDAAFAARQAVLEDGLDAVGEILHRSWQVKKVLAPGISDPSLDVLYERACAAGATGGKLSGAGGGGFLLVYCPRERQNALREVLADLRELPFMMEPDGSKVIFNVRRYEWK
jgi:D-glycero-alpha-D-manno-heptose-7-phosphate kinase